MLPAYVIPEVPYYSPFHNDLRNCLSACDISTGVITFSLRDLREYPEAFDTVARVASLVYKLLYSIGCNEKETIRFQARRGTIFSKEYTLVIHPNPRCLPQTEGSISHCFAHINMDLSGGKLIFYLNELPIEAYAVISVGLLKLFPQPRNCTIL